MGQIISPRLLRQVDLVSSNHRLPFLVFCSGQVYQRGKFMQLGHSDGRYKGALISRR